MSSQKTKANHQLPVAIGQLHPSPHTHISYPEVREKAGTERKIFSKLILLSKFDEEVKKVEEHGELTNLCQIAADITR
jgi:hypothetical protein